MSYKSPVMLFGSILTHKFENIIVFSLQYLLLSFSLQDTYFLEFCLF